ncbi:MAG: epoxide hydrolase family protein [Pseudomonadota bacterium]
MTPNLYNPKVSKADIKDFRDRLSRTRLPDPELVSDWSQGLPIEIATELLDSLRTHDFQYCLDRMTAIGSYQIAIDGLKIHYLHKRGPAGAIPLILTHGWPGGIIEFLDVADALSEQFHLVIPSLPGFGLSNAPKTVGWGLEKIADVWAELMSRLGYDRYVAQGGDWGSEVSALLAQRHPDHCRGAHINMVSARPPKPVISNPTDSEAKQLGRLKDWGRMEMAYFRQQASRPQTLGYALADSPLGQACWIAEKFHAWTDHDDANPFGGVDYSRILDLICLYWFTNSATSSARLYWESAYGSGRTQIDAPIACALYPAEINAPSKRWAETRFTDIVHWTELDRGGHFPALEVPDLFVENVIEGVHGVWGSHT